jgi:hypoxanthine phosphoribosyltransferase
MQRRRGMIDNIKALISEEKINVRINELAKQISKDYEGKSVHLICILKGSVFFSCDLAKRITVPVTMDFMSVSSYGDEKVSSGRVRIVKDLDESIQDKHVIIIEDIIDSGRTLAYLNELLGSRSPASLNICTLLDKPDRRVVDVYVKYVGFEIPDEFVVGYGLDYEQGLRNLPYVGVVKLNG